MLLKKWAADWHDIMRGVALCVGERPNDVKVVGAGNGSIILVLAGTASATLTLAVIVKNIGKIVHEVLKITNAIEDLRHKKILNRTIETELKNKQKVIQDEGVETTVKAVKTHLGRKIDAEVEAALTKSVKKYLYFSDRGGDVDFLEPPGMTGFEEVGEGEELLLEGVPAELRLLHETLVEVRNTNSEIRQLTDQSDEDE